MRRWKLLPAGARVAVAVSGGIDSLCLVYLLGRHNRSLSEPLHLSGLHVRLASDGVSGGLGDATRELLAQIGLELEEVEPRFEPGEEPPFDCFRCARVRRRTLLEAASARGLSHLALGHHADDVVETWLLSLFYTGHSEVLAPLRSYFGGAVTLVRPMYELQKRELVRLAGLAGFPAPQPVCPLERDSRRRRVATALAALGRDERLVRRQLYWAAVRQYEVSGGQHEQ